MWCTPLILALRRQRQVGLHEFEDNLVYKMSFRPAKDNTVRDLISKRRKKKRGERGREERGGGRERE